MPTRDKGVGDKPTRDTKVRDKPVRGKPVRDKAVREKPVRGKPVRDKAVREKPVRDKAVREKPVRDKPVRDKGERRRPLKEAPARDLPARERGKRPVRARDGTVGEAAPTAAGAPAAGAGDRRAPAERPPRPGANGKDLLSGGRASADARPMRSARPPRGTAGSRNARRPPAATSEPRDRSEGLSPRSRPARPSRSRRPRGGRTDGVDRGRPAAGATGRVRQRPGTPASERPLLADQHARSVLSATLPWLRVRAHEMQTLEGRPVTLRGVNLGGFDSVEPDDEGFRSASGIDDRLLDQFAQWGATTVRLPISRDRVLDGSGPFSGWDFLSEIDAVVAAAAARGMYTVLALRRVDERSVFGSDPSGAPEPVAPQPDYDSVGMWRVIAERYANEPAVLFDLYSGPHSARPDDITGMTSDWDLWTFWARLAVAEMRRVHPRCVCIVAGHARGTDLAGFPVTGGGGPLPNIVYGVRIMRGQAPGWDELAGVARRFPVMVTEWAGSDDDTGWAQRTADALWSHGVAWIAGPEGLAPGRGRSPTTRGFLGQIARSLQRDLAVAAPMRAQIRTVGSETTAVDLRAAWSQRWSSTGVVTVDGERVTEWTNEGSTDGNR